MENGHTVYRKTINPDLDSITKSRPELEGAENKVWELAECIRPVVYWADFPLKICGGNRVILGEDALSINSFYLARGLKGFARATLMAATIGDALPGYSDICVREGRLWEGTVADILGSLAVDAVVRKFCRLLSTQKEDSGLYPSLRYSPGYGDWSLEDQALILSLLDTGPEITMGPGCLLEPVKSVTVLVGWSVGLKQDIYPVGDREKGLCQGTGSCSSCRTWACIKDR